MRHLVSDMCKENPKERLNIDEVMERFDNICVRLSDWKLRSRVASKRERWIITLFRSFRHRCMQINLARQGTPAIPNWPSDLVNRRRPGILGRIFPRFMPAKN